MISNQQRRSFLQKSLAVGAWFWTAALGGRSAFAAVSLWPADKFAAGPVSKTLEHLFGGRAISESNDIELKIPLIAENGAIVPLTISSRLPNVKSIYLLVEKNPVPLAAQFDFSPELEAFVSARIKMAETSLVIAVAETDQGLFSTRQLVKVTIGGCGG